MEKQDAAFSKSVVEIKSRKSKSEFLLFASLSAEKVSDPACKVFGKKSKIKSKRKKRVNC